MPDEWIIRVEGKEYGPANLEVLREWRLEGRVLPANDARPTDDDAWVTAAQIPDLFESSSAPPVQTWAPPDSGEHPARPARSFSTLCRETFRIYATGFWQFSFLTLLVIVPSACAQLTSVALDASGGLDNDLRGLLAGAFAFCMLLLGLFLWPVYVAGIQILSAEIVAGRSVGFFTLLNHALKFWPRVAGLSLFVYGSYFFWTVLLIGSILLILLGTPSFASIFLVLLLLALWVWIVGRLFVNFLFWPQFSVLAGFDLAETLRRSKELARSGRDLPRSSQPLWRGIFLASIWFAFVAILDLGVGWSSLRHYYHELAASPNPDAMMQTLKTASNSHGFDLLAFALGLWQGLMRPLLGIAFVVLYFDSSGDNPPS